jgi:hypothetical protein
LDIKLSNLMLTTQDESVLTDFEEAEQKVPVYIKWQMMSERSTHPGPLGAP